MAADPSVRDTHAASAAAGSGAAGFGAAGSGAAGSAAALAAALEGPAVVAALAGHTVVRVRGSDARSFLHGQLAADVTGLAVGEAVRSLLLNHRGHALAEAMVVRRSDDLLVVVEDGAGDWVRSTLAEHIIFDDVTLERVDDVACLTVQGVRAADVVTGVLSDASVAVAAVEPGSSPRFWHGSVSRQEPAGTAEVVVYPRRRSAAGGIDIVVFSGSGAADRAEGSGAGLTAGSSAGSGAEVTSTAADVLADLVAAGAVAVTASAIDAARVAACVTTVGGEGGEGVLPQEADLTEALSYRKGCYLGQEVMARIEARGSLKRGIATVELIGEDGASGPGRAQEDRAIRASGRPVGVLGTSAVMPDGRVLALAVVRHDLEDGSELSAGGRRLRLLRAVTPILSS